MSQLDRDLSPEVQGPEVMKVDLDQLAQHEAATRPDRLNFLNSQVDSLFEGPELEELREDIKISFNVPQWGDYHNEGVFMDTHLAAILASVDAIDAGQFHPDLPDHIQRRLSGVVAGRKQSIQKYVFTHDIVKRHKMVVKDADGERNEVSWEDWEASLPEGVQGNPVAMREYLKSQGIQSIGYPKHGKPGAARVQEFGEHLDVPDVLLTAIRKHEVAFNFERINAKTFADYFGKLSEDEIAWVMTASYVDTMASYRDNGQPNLSAFMNMVHSEKVYKIHERLKADLYSDGKKKPAEGLDKQKIKGYLESVMKTEGPIEHSYEEMLEHAREACKISVYDAAKFAASLDSFVTLAKLDAETAHTLKGAIDENGHAQMRVMGPIFPKLGEAAQLVKEALKSAEVK